MLLCWLCNNPVKRDFHDGWFCTRCGQHGDYTKVAKSREEGRDRNSPYSKEVETPNE